MNRAIYQFFLNLSILLLGLLTTTPSFGMFTTRNNNPHNNHILKYIQRTPKRRATNIFKMDLLGCKPRLLLERPPFNFPELPEDLQLKILALASPPLTNKLQKTCTSLHKKGTIQFPQVLKIACHSPLCMADKDISTLILKAILSDMPEMLENLLQNTKHRNFRYQYSCPGNVKVLFFDAYHATVYSEQAFNMLKKHSCTMLESASDKISIKPTKLMAACYTQDHQIIIDVMKKNNNSFTDDELNHSLFIALDHQNKGLIHTLFYLKKRNYLKKKLEILNNGDMVAFNALEIEDYRNDLHVFSDHALKIDKMDAFESIIACNQEKLNKHIYGTSKHDSYLSAMILSNKRSVNIERCAEIVKKYGGTTTKELLGIPKR